MTSPPPVVHADVPTADPHDVPLALDVRHVAPMLTGGRALALAPVSAATWAGIGQAVIAGFVSLAASIVLLTGVMVGVSLLVVVVGVPLLVLTLVLARGYGAVERARLRTQLGVVVPEPRPGPGRAYDPRTWWAWLRDGQAWAAVAHAALTCALTWTAASLALALVASALVVPVTPFTDRVSVPHLALLAPVAVAAVWLAALVLQLTTLAQVRLGRLLLGGRSRADAERAARAAEQRATVAEGRAVHLHETRTAAVVAADEERRRIERDLHDGAQQRLVALGVELGVARRAAAHDPAVAVAAVDAAHGEVKEVLAELRDLVRGVHPAVLTDRGLDAALSALAARCPVPVDVDADGLGTSVGPQAQAAAYFVVAEALTNVAKHAGATRAGVRATVRGDRLRIEVSDDGTGAAQAAPGGGLDGLRRRVEALDGTFDLTSPAGRGTVLTVEVPCAS
ncbi:sensor histidine kinase [Cellulomonas sp. S1-8]|uniref:sensor histidine kinase n=1 Tax=Cellulomonas sp. S1-8 TaxID=2904790 RepID=UPI0022445002|nr:sensor domain-containing protein [Cellulomonas sp. S1-8]UZN02822.1 sensor domain-containing protein [Cellulomonas sp. S1-8]